MTTLTKPAGVKIDIDDNAALVTITTPQGYKPPREIVRGWHDATGELGYCIRFEVFA